MVNDRITHPSGAWALVLSTSCVLAFAYACWDIQNFDVWWHLNAGQWIVENQAIPRVEPFTHTLAGIPWNDYEWAAQPVLYAVERLGGSAGLLIMTAAAAAAMAACLVLAMRACGAGPAAAGLCTGAILYVSQVRILPRPEIFSLLFLAVVVLLVSRWRLRPARLVWTLPVLFLVWGNVHPGVLGGLLLLGCLFAGEVATRLLRRPTVDELPSLKPFVWAAALSGIAVLVNPYGFAAPLESLNLVNSEFTKYVREWTPTLDAVNRGKPWVIGWLAWVAFLAVSAPLLWRRRRFAELLVVLVFLPMTLRHVRMTATYAIVTGVAAAVGASAWATLLRRNRPGGGYLAAAVVAVLLLVNTALILSGTQYAWQRDSRRVGLGVHAENYPVQATEFLKSTGIRGTMYNEYRWGGWLAWTLDDPVLQDGRNLDFEQFMAARSIRDAQPGFQRHIDRYGVDYFIVSQPRPDEGRPILQYLRSQSHWVLVFWDDAALVYVKRIPRFEEVIDRYGYSCVDPLERRVSGEQIRESLQCISEEFEQAKRWSPFAGSVRMLAGQIYERAGLRQRALAEYREGQQIHPELPFWSRKIGALGD
jgi:hypothetical protein